MIATFDENMLSQYMVVNYRLQHLDVKDLFYLSLAFFPIH